MHDTGKTEATTTTTGERERGVKETESVTDLVSFARLMLPAWVAPPHMTKLLESLAVPGSVCRMIFNLGRAWELREQARKLIATRAVIHGARASSVIVDELAGGVSRG